MKILNKKKRNQTRNAILIDYRDGWWNRPDTGFYADLVRSRTINLPRKKRGREDKIREYIGQSTLEEYKGDSVSLQYAPFSFKYHNKWVSVWLDENGQYTQPVAAMTIGAPQPGLWGNVVLEYKNPRYEFDADIDLTDVYLQLFKAIAQYWHDYYVSMNELRMQNLVEIVS